MSSVVTQDNLERAFGSVIVQRGPGNVQEPGQGLPALEQILEGPTEAAVGLSTIRSSSCCSIQLSSR